MYLYGKDPYEAEYHFLINKRESAGLKYLNDSKAFIEYSNNLDDTCKENIEKYNPNKRWKTLIVLDDMIANMHNNQNRNKIVNELFISGRKINFLLFFSLNHILKYQRMMSKHYESCFYENSK